MEAAVQADKRVREDVTPQVQALFDTLAKQYNCEWREATNMIHMPDLQLIIEAPYKPENCQGKEANALMHLKKVLTGIRQKQGMDYRNHGADGRWQAIRRHHCTINIRSYIYINENNQDFKYIYQVAYSVKS